MDPKPLPLKGDGKSGQIQMKLPDYTRESKGISPLSGYRGIFDGSLGFCLAAHRLHRITAAIT